MPERRGRHTRHACPDCIATFATAAALATHRAERCKGIPLLSEAALLALRAVNDGAVDYANPRTIRSLIDSGLIEWIGDGCARDYRITEKGERAPVRITDYGFDWGPMRVIRYMLVKRGDREFYSLGVETGHHKVEVYSSRTGRSVRVWIDGKEVL